MPKLKLRALKDLSLRRSADPADPAFEQWYEWKAGEVFTPPANLNIALALEKGKVEEVHGGQG